MSNEIGLGTFIRSGSALTLVLAVLGCSGGGGFGPGSDVPGSTAGTTAGSTAGTTAGSTAGLLETVSTVAGNNTGPLVNDVGKTVTTLGNPVSGGTSGIPAFDNLTNTVGGLVTKVGNGVSQTGTGLTGNGLAGLPVVGTTVGSLDKNLDGNVLNPLLSITVLNKQISGSPSGADLLNASVLSKSVATGAPVSASVLADGQAVKLGSGSGLLGGLTSGLTSGTTAGGLGGLVKTVTGTVTRVTGGLTGGTTAGAVTGLLTF